MPSSPLSHPLPQTIKALLQPDIHSPKLILATIPTPVATPGTTEHLIHVHSTSPCAGELTWTANISAYASLLPTLSPSSVTAKLQIPCYDLSGTVVTAPPNSPFPPGTEIHTRTSFARSGNARAYTIALTSELARKPSNLSWEEAASVPLSAFTAWQALGGDAASAVCEGGGIGEVIGVCSAGNAEMVRGLGADEVLDYGREGVEAWGKRTRRKVDLVVDLLGGESLAQAWKVVKKGGRVVSIKEDPNAKKPADGVADDVEGKFFVMEPEGWQLEETAKLIEKGQVKPTVDSVWPLRDFAKAFAIVEGGHSRGKVIINVSE
ncbi:quinone oxidoreductase-like chloroplastic protein [Botrytis cinerea]